MISKRVCLTHHAAYCPLRAGSMGRESRWGGVPATGWLPWGAQAGVEAASGPGPRVASAARGCWRGWGLCWGSGCTWVSVGTGFPSSASAGSSPWSGNASPGLVRDPAIPAELTRISSFNGDSKWISHHFSLDRIFDVYCSFSSLWARDIFLS